MADFSVILQSPQVRAIVQENLLERAFHDALFPGLLFRSEAQPVKWPGGTGDTHLFTAPGLIAPNVAPMRPGTDPTPVDYPVEQWFAQLQQYAGTIDVNMPTSMVAIADLFLRGAHQIGLQGAQSINRAVRDRLYNAAESGWTVVDGAQTTTTTLRIKRLNGFTRARNPNLAAASQVRFDFVSSTNPLAITVYDNGAATANTVIGFSPDTPGDEFGPGTITLGTQVTSCADRAYIYTADRSGRYLVGGALKTDSLTSSNIPTLADVRTAVSGLRLNNVPKHADGRYHCHYDPISESKLFADQEFQRLFTALPDYFVYRDFAIGEIMGTVFYENTEAPIASTVVGGTTATYDARDPFAPELFHNGNASTGMPLHHMLFTGQDATFEYFSDLGELISEAGINGKVADAKIVNNGIEVMADRIQMIIRGPLNRLQDQVSISWKLIADWPMRTDAAAGDAKRYKRCVACVHGE